MRELSPGSGPRLPDAISRKRLIGALLVKEGLITRPALEEALGVQARMEGYQPIGQILVERSLVTRQQLDLVLERYRKNRRLGDVLVEAKALTEAQLTAALTHRRGTDRRLGEVLVGLGLVSERRVRKALSAQLGIAFVDLDGMGLEPGLAGLLSEGYARRHRVVPVRKKDGRVTVAMEDPADLETLEDLRGSLGSGIEVVTAKRAAFDRALARIYGHAPEGPDTLAGERQEDEPRPDALATAVETGGGGAGGGDMEVNAGDLRTVVDSARRMVADWDRFVASVEALTKEDEERRAALARLEASQRELRQENEMLRDARERLSRELQTASQGLAELRVAHESLVRDHDAATAALRDVRERHDTLQRDRQFAADQLESVLSRIKF